MKAVIAPVVAFLILVLQKSFGVELPTDMGGQITDGVVTAVTVGTTLYGLIRHIIVEIKARKAV